MKTRIMCTLIALQLLKGTVAFAQGQEGHGGDVLDINGTPRLYDLVTRATCEWKQGQEILAIYPSIDRILKKIAPLNWYLAASLRREIRDLKYCLTGDLFKIDPPDQTEAIRGDIREFEKARQAGIRVGNRVYVDRRILKGMLETEKGFFFVHEAVHAYIGNDVDDRKHKVWDVVAAFGRVDKRALTSASQLAFQLTESDFDFPLGSAGRLEPYRNQIDFLLADPARRRELILQSADPESLANLPVQQVNALLSPRDRIRENPSSTLQQELRSILLDGSDSDFGRVLAKSRWSKVQPVLLAYSAFGELSAGKQVALKRSGKISTLVKQSYAWFTGLKTENIRYRCMANPDVQALASADPKSAPVPFISLIPRAKFIRNQAPLPSQALASAVFARMLVQNASWEELRTSITDNPLFYRAFSLKDLLDGIRQSKTYFPEEQAPAIKMAKNIRYGLVQEWLGEAVRGLTSEQVSQFRKMIHFKEFEQ
jgi:hypothetical protein